MENRNPQIEELLTEIVQQYREVDAQLETLLLESEQGEWSEQATQQVLQHLASIQRLSAAAGQAAQSRPTGNRPEGQLRQVTQLFQSMLAKIARLEKSASEARDRLLPQVNAGVRALQMQRAYGGVRS